MIEIILGLLFLVIFWFLFRELCYRLYVWFGTEHLRRRCEFDSQVMSEFSLKTHVAFRFMYYGVVGFGVLFFISLISYGVGSIIIYLLGV